MGRPRVACQRRRTNVARTGITFATASGAAAQPHLGLDDVSSPPPAGTNFNLLDIRDPRRRALSIDNPDRSLFPTLQPQTPPLTTVVSNHPMVTGTGTEVALTPPGTAMASPFRFAYLRTFETDANGSWLPLSSMHDLRYERQRVSGGAPVLYEDRWRLDPYKHMAVIVDRTGEANGFRYLLDWYDALTPTVPSAIPVHTQVWLGEMKPGDIGWIGLKRYANNHPVTGQPPTVRRATSILNQGLGQHPSELVPAVLAASWPELDAATETSMLRDQTTGVLWLKITSTDMIRLEDDGMGQAIMVDF